MCTENSLKNILGDVFTYAKNELGNSLTTVILYGSYARGDYDSESDIDVMVIADISSEEIKKVSKKFSAFSLDVDLKYDIVLSIIVQDKTTFEKYKATYPLFKNIVREGVEFCA